MLERIRDDASSIGEDNLGAKQVVERETKSRTERTVSAAEREADHADPAAIAGDGGGH